GGDILDLTLEVVAKVSSSSTTVLKEAEAGESESKNLILELERVPDSSWYDPIVEMFLPSVEVNIIEEDGRVSSKSTILTFHDPYKITTGTSKTQGTYYVTINGVQSNAIKFNRGSPTGDTKVQFKEAIAELLDTSTSNIAMYFHSDVSGVYEYRVVFKSTIANDVNEISVSNDFNTGNVTFGTLEYGSSSNNETQNVTIETQENVTGEYTLSFKYDGTSYTTERLDFTASITEIETALNEAITIAGAEFEVTGSSEDFSVEFKGTLAKINVSKLSVSTYPVPTEASGGSFELTLDGESVNVAYDEDATQQAQNIETAIASLSVVGENNVTVIVDSTKNDLTTFKIVFKEGKTETDISLFKFNTSNLVNVSMSMQTLNNGKEAESEEQLVSFNSTAKSGTFTLSWSHDGTDYSSEAISLNATKSEVQSAIDTMITSLSEASIVVGNWTNSELELSFEGNLRGIDVANVAGSVTAKLNPSTVNKTVVGTSVTEVITEKKELVIDHKAKNYELLTGTDKYLTLTVDGQRGEVTELSGDINLNVSGFFQVSGSLSLIKEDSTVILDDGSNVDVDLLRIAG
ncbi:MAG: Unknown protein, partial [uncultured Sulfurovum sp.]